MRLNLSLTQKSSNRLDSIVNNSKYDFTSKSEVIRMAVSLLDYLIKEEEKGYTISVTKYGKSVKDIVIKK